MACAHPHDLMLSYCLPYREGISTNSPDSIQNYLLLYIPLTLSSSVLCHGFLEFAVDAFFGKTYSRRKGKSQQSGAEHDST
jgi:hypothetical protein